MNSNDNVSLVQIGLQVRLFGGKSEIRTKTIHFTQALALIQPILGQLLTVYLCNENTETSFKHFKRLFQ